MPKREPIIETGSVTGIEGKWLVVVKGKVVASSDNPAEMLQCAEKFPPEDVTVTKVLFANASFY